MITGGWSGLKAVSSLVPILGNTTAEGTGIGVSRVGYYGVLMVAEVGISGDTLAAGLYWTISFQHCLTDTAGSYANIPAAFIEGGANDHVINAAAEDPTIVVRGYTGPYPWVRILFTQTGTHTNGTPISGVVVLSDSIRVPVDHTTELGG